MKKVNELIGMINDLRIEQMSEKLGIVRQNLIDITKKWENGGNVKIINTKYILSLIKEAKV